MLAVTISLTAAPPFIAYETGKLLTVLVPEFLILILIGEVLPSSQLLAGLTILTTSTSFPTGGIMVKDVAALAVV